MGGHVPGSAVSSVPVLTRDRHSQSYNKVFLDPAQRFRSTFSSLLYPVAPLAHSLVPSLSGSFFWSICCARGLLKNVRYVSFLGSISCPTQGSHQSDSAARVRGLLLRNNNPQTVTPSLSPVAQAPRPRTRLKTLPPLSHIWGN